jgi:hypothetical protein
MSISDDYKLAAYHALAGFQLLEKNIKDYLNQHNALVQFLIQPDLVYNFSVDENNGMALSGLLKRFKKVSNKTDLISDINSLISDRDNLAHSALIGVYHDVSENEYKAFIESFKQVSNRLKPVNNYLLKETVSLIALTCRKTGEPFPKELTEYLK